MKFESLFYWIRNIYIFLENIFQNNMNIYFTATDCPNFNIKIMF